MNRTRSRSNSGSTNADFQRSVSPDHDPRLDPSGSFSFDQFSMNSRFFFSFEGPIQRDEFHDDRSIYRVSSLARSRRDQAWKTVTNQSNVILRTRSSSVRQEGNRNGKTDFLHSFQFLRSGIDDPSTSFGPNNHQNHPDHHDVHRSSGRHASWGVFGTTATLFEKPISTPGQRPDEVRRTPKDQSSRNVEKERSDFKALLERKLCKPKIHISIDIPIVDGPPVSADVDSTSTLGELRTVLLEKWPALRAQPMRFFRENGERFSYADEVFSFQQLRLHSAVLQFRYHL